MKSTNSALNGTLTYVFDLDGVIYRGKEPQPHAQEVVLTLRNQGHAVRFYTNNAAKHRDTYLSKLETLGIPTPVDHIMTSSYATALYFLEHNAAGKTVYRVGEQGMAREFEAVGMNVVYDLEEPSAKIDYVVVGLDRDFHYRKIARAQEAILAGAQFIATNEDATFPMEGDRLLPGGGCMVAAIRTATNVEPFVVGKPSVYAYNKILELTRCAPENSVMIGDRLDTDIAVGNRAGADTVLVLTGVTSRQEGETATGDYKPKRIIRTLEELL